MSAKKQTSLDWFFEKLTDTLGEGIKKVMLEEFNQAKAMEKQQIQDAYCKGKLHYVSNEIRTTEQYYNETYIQ